MEGVLTGTIKSISRIPSMTFANKRTFGVITAGINMTGVSQTFINVWKKIIEIRKNEGLVEKEKQIKNQTNERVTY